MDKTLCEVSRIGIANNLGVFSNIKGAESYTFTQVYYI